VVEFNFVLGEIDGLAADETATALLDVQLPNQIISLLASETAEKARLPHPVAPPASLRRWLTLPMSRQRSRSAPWA
jgi:hypothetical protein